jgi:hypothetical protein
MMCTFGMTPSALVVLPNHRVQTNQMPDANINDHIPMTNIMPFGMCITPTNPAVAAATSAALGVLTPVPCVPVTPSPWVPGAVSPPVILDGAPALDNTNILTCTWGGVITFQTPGEFTVNIP